jgi:glyoxylate/hydroxypyruvate reductase A
MTILFYSEVDDPEPWRLALARELPSMEFKVWPDTGPLERVSYALVWKPKPGLLNALPGLKAILSLGAGVDHLLHDPQLPGGVPIVRTLDAGFANQMSEYALYGVLYFHRQMGDYMRQQRRGQWRQLPALTASECSVGVMGLGILGMDFVHKLMGLGYRVLGWSRTPKSIPGVLTFCGPGGFEPFLAGLRVLVNCLPLTPETRGVLNARTFATLPRGAAIVNIARGAHLVEGDLLAALDSGHLSGALLDVFQEEPLPSAHAFWQHPKIVITPHIAGQAITELMVSQVADNIRRIERGQPPLGSVDPARGY